MNPEVSGFVEFSPKLYWAISELPVWTEKCGYRWITAEVVMSTIMNRGGDTGNLDKATCEKRQTLLAAMVGDILSYRDASNPHNYVAPTVTLRQTQQRLFMELSSKLRLFDGGYTETYDRVGEPNLPIGAKLHMRLGLENRH